MQQGGWHAFFRTVLIDLPKWPMPLLIDDNLDVVPKASIGDLAQVLNARRPP